MPIGQQQRAKSDFIAFTQIAKMNTRLARVALPETDAAWIENLQLVGPNNMLPIPAPLPALTILTGNRQAQTTFFAVVGGTPAQAGPPPVPFTPGTDYAIVFTTSGAGIAVNLSTGAQTLFAPDGTFSNADMTPFASQRILIADPTAGYSQWDGTVFTTGGGVSPNISVTAGGTYSSTPTVAITGGSGTGATAVAVMGGTGAAQFVAKVQVTNSGTGYKAGDTLTVTFTPTGATATAKVWPITACTTVAAFAGRVWTGNGRVLAWTGTLGFDDVNTANAAGSTTISDMDLAHSITALRNLNNYLFIFGDQSVRSIGQISVNQSITIFTPLVLSSDIGTTFPLTIQSYNRLVLFANKVGVFAIFGSSVEKISDDMDGIFSGGSTGSGVHSNIDFTQPLCAAVQDLRNIHCYLLLVRYIDPVAGTRSLILVFQEKFWTVASVGNNVKTMCPTFTAQFQQWDTFVSSGPDVTQIMQDANTAVPVKLVTSLTPHGNPLQAKQPISAGIGLITPGSTSLTMQIDSENFSRGYNLITGNYLQWINNSGLPIRFVNSQGQPIYFGVGGYTFPYTSVDGNGKFLGMTITANMMNSVINMAAIEFQDGKLWGIPVFQ
jgi:hypothetical protein